MFGIGGAAATSPELLGILKTLMGALNNPQQAAAILKDIQSNIDELLRVRNEAAAIQADNRGAIDALKATNDDLKAVKAETEAKLAALQQGIDAQAAKERVLNQRELDLNEATKKTTADIVAARAKLTDTANEIAVKRRDLKVAETDLEKARTEFENFVSAKNEELASQKAAIDALAEKAAQDAVEGAKLKAQFEAKLAAINEFSQAVTKAEKT